MHPDRCTDTALPIAPSVPVQQKKSPEMIVAVILLLVTVSTLIAWYNYRLHFNGFLRNDNHEYCEIARNFQAGNGYSTTVLRPLAYKFFQTLPQPEVTRMPGYPFTLSLFFRMLGPNDITVILFNSIFFVILIVLAFLVTFELSGNIFVSAVTALATAAMEAFFRDTITAEPNIFYAALFLLFVYLYLKFPAKLLLHGFLLALLYLVRPNTLFVLAGLSVAFLATGQNWRQRIQGCLILAGGFALGLIPYMIRNHAVIGKPFFSLYKYSLLLMTKGFPLYSAWTIIPDIDPTAYALAHPAEMIQKAVNAFFFLVDDFFAVYRLFFLAMIGIGFFIRQTNSRITTLKIMIVVGFISQTIMLLPVGSVAYYYLFFFPLIIAIAATSAHEKSGRYGVPVLLAVLAVFLYTAAPYWKHPRPVNPFPSIGKQIAALTEKDDIILTDIPWEVAWYADRRTIWLPLNRETLTTISKTLKPKYILLLGLNYAPYKDNLWQRMAQSPDLAETMGYRLSALVEFGNRPIAPLFKSLD